MIGLRQENPWSSERSVRSQSQPPRPLAVIGTGNVGGELLSLLRDRSPERLSVVGVANSRRMLRSRQGLVLDGLEERLNVEGEPSDLGRLVDHLSFQSRSGIVVDLTASAEVAACHGAWLSQGLSVVTANKWAAAGDLADYQALLSGDQQENYRYATTVGAGLPLLDSIHRLHGAGERIISVAGLFSGTLSYLMQGLAEGRPFSACLWKAHELGLTEPDPRLDLSGLDVARKLVITARAAGIALSLDQVAIESLLPKSVIAMAQDDFFAQAGPLLDEHWQRLSEAGRWEAGVDDQAVPRFVGAVGADGHASVGIQWLPPAHPFVGVGATDNVFEIRSDSYRETPLIIRGPGAGSRVTAVQVLADIHALS